MAMQWDCMAKIAKAIVEQAQVAKTLLLTTQCNAGCQHCPFSSLKMEPRWLSLKSALRIIEKAEEKLIVISGGEPLEHPEIADILKQELHDQKKFRVATGGYIDISPYISVLKKNKSFHGISMGTDVISNRCNNRTHYEIWQKNIINLNSTQTAYSLTFTIAEDLEPLESLLKKMNLIDLRPSFIYVRAKKANFNQENREILGRQFGTTPLFFDELMSEEL